MGQDVHHDSAAEHRKEWQVDPVSAGHAGVSMVRHNGQVGRSSFFIGAGFVLFQLGSEFADQYGRRYIFQQWQYDFHAHWMAFHQI